MLLTVAYPESLQGCAEVHTSARDYQLVNNNCTIVMNLSYHWTPCADGIRLNELIK